ncbi:putative glutathione S-transferase GSTF1 [Acorus gramineus]|uniref:glutathione transferase n=1 Tax=Acorus gramineus TaxID=55184 RepID=A0AAV9BUU2_ACOGR|nr:putative glutathione S-transferase GSTF1 [Acorus gramineus]
MGGIVKVYGMPMSTATSRVLMTLEEKEASYELVLVNILNGEHKHPDHLARNPFGQIPAFEDGSLMLFESRAVARYVAKKYESGTDLLRSGNLEEAALVDVWLDVEANHFNAPIYAISYQYVIVPRLFGGAPDEKVVEENTAKLEKVLDVYEERLSKSKYLAGDFFSLADLSHFPYIHRLLRTPKATLITSRPHVNAWWEAISSRPAYKKVAAGITFGD